MNNPAGLTIQVRVPAFQGTEIVDSVKNPASYSQTLAAFGGYVSASFSVIGDQNELEHWYEFGLMRDITVYDGEQQELFNGFVDSVSLSIGGAKIDRGPVMDMINRLSVAYSTVDTSVSPPAVGMRVTTPVVNHAQSQELYGILQGVYSASGMTETDALNLRDTLLAEKALPETNQDISFDGATPVVTVNCLGYVELLKKFTYTSTATGLGNLSDKVKAVLAAHPNGLFSNVASIAANTLQVPQYDNDDKLGYDVIQGLVALGNSSYNRFVFGIYKNREVIYSAIPTAFDYQYRMSENQAELYGGGALYPWQILPAKWVFLPDFLKGRGAVTNLRQDPRALFIESVTYTAPYSLAINGKKVNTSAQMIEQYGLGGVAA